MNIYLSISLILITLLVLILIIGIRNPVHVWVCRKVSK